MKSIEAINAKAIRPLIAKPSVFGPLTLIQIKPRIGLATA